MNSNQTKDIEAINDCIAEAQRYIKRCKEYKAKVAATKKEYYSHYNMGCTYAAILRSAMDLKRIMTRFSKRWRGNNYGKTWDEVE